MNGPPNLPAEAPPTGGHHALAVHEVVLLLATDVHRGLGADEAARRLERFGPNVLPTTGRAGLWRRTGRQFHNPLVYVLIAAGAITAALGERVDSAVILGVVVVNAVIGVVQESRAEAALESLRSMVSTAATLVRDGRKRVVPSEELVPGDLVLLEAGDQAPADLRLVRHHGLRVDESALTGESVPVRKDELAVPGHAPVADRRNMVHAGTLVTTGSGAGVVTATGSSTELGEIHRLIGAADVLATPLTRKLAGFSRVLTVGILALAAATFAVGTARGEDPVATFTAAVALAVGAIPEGLPAAVTITMAIGVARMARRRAVIRRLPAVETLGSTTVVCSDKTGTLTQNQMTVRSIWTPGGRYEVTGAAHSRDGAVCDSVGNRVDLAVDQALRWSLLAGAGCTDAALTHQGERWEIVGDPTEGALLVAAAKAGLTVEQLTHQLPRVATLPFTSERQYMVTLHRDPTVREGGLLLAKGAVERVLGLCDHQLDSTGTARPLDRAAALEAAAALASQGMRVLATAVRHGVPPDATLEDAGLGGFALTGLQAMLDPPREGAVAAVAACRTAGVSVKMITGDHDGTATAVAARVGLLDGLDAGDGLVLTGPQLDSLPSEALPDAVDRATVLARVSPEQKLRLVQALQSQGHVVAMTGDGVNDAPALRQADIGVAMGRSGTEVAKDAADMVLTDDDFATIEAAVEEGRGVFDNLTKFIAWTLPTNIGEGLVILVAIMLGTSLPILPTQILWINMTTAVLLGLMLAFEPKESGIMTRPPRDPRQPLLTPALAVRIVLISLLLVLGSWWLFDWELAHGAGLAEARTAAVNLFVAVQASYLFSCRSATVSAWRLGWFSNRWIVVGVLVQGAGQLGLTYLPAMNRVFDTYPLGTDTWLRIAGLTLVTSVLLALSKRVHWSRGRSEPGLSWRHPGGRDDAVPATRGDRVRMPTSRYPRSGGPGA